MWSAALPVQRQRLVVGEHAPAGRLEQRLRTEQVVEQLRRGQHRPHAVERCAHLVGAAQHLANRAAGRLRRRASVTPAPPRPRDSTNRRPALCRRNRRRAARTIRGRLLGAQADVAGAERERPDRRRSGRWRSAIAWSITSDIRGIALEPRPRASRHRRRRGAGTDVGHEVGEHDLLDAGLAERRQHPLDVAEEHPVRPDDQHALVLEREPVGVQQVRRAVQRHHGLAGAGTALHDEHAGLR